MYPVDSICRKKDEQRKEILDDLIRNTVHKVFIVSWTDSYDYSWLDEFGIDRTVVFDAEEEDDMLYLLLDNEKQFSIGISYIVDIEKL